MICARRRLAELFRRANPVRRAKGRARAGCEPLGPLVSVRRPAVILYGVPRLSANIDVTLPSNRTPRIGSPRTWRPPGSACAWRSGLRSPARVMPFIHTSTGMPWMSCWPVRLEDEFLRGRGRPMCTARAAGHRSGRPHHREGAGRPPEGHRRRRARSGSCMAAWSTPIASDRRCGCSKKRWPKATRFRRSSASARPSDRTERRP